MQLVSTIDRRIARTAGALALVLLISLGSAALASANSPTVLPVEPDGGIGGEIVLPVEPDGGIGIGVDLPLPVEPDGGIGN